MPKTIIITGAGGFVGRALTQQLRAEGHVVIALGRGSDPAEEGDQYFQCDLEKSALAELDLPQGGLVIHLASLLGRTKSQRADMSARNLRIAQNVASLNPKRLIVMSSVAARIAEEAGPNTREYGRSKAQVDAYFAKALPEAKIVTLRPPAIYGQGMRGPLRILAAFIAKGVPLPLGAARAERDYLSVENLAGFVANLVRSPDPIWAMAAEEPIELCDQQPISTRNLIQQIAAVQGRPARLITVPHWVLRGLGAMLGKGDLISGSIDPLNCRDHTRLYKAMNWQPDHKMPESLRGVFANLSGRSKE